MRDSIQDSTLEVHLEHHADGPGQAWVHAHGKIQPNDLALLQQRCYGGKWLPPRCLGCAFPVEFDGGTERPFDAGIVVKERQKNGDAFDNRALQFLVEVFPIAVVPAFDGIQLFFLVRVNAGSARFMLDAGLDAQLLQNLSLAHFPHFPFR